MKISIIKPDSMTFIDNLGYGDLDLSSVASNIYAIQFDTSTNTGHIEYNDGTVNEDIVSISTYQSIVDAHAAQKTNIETTAAANKETLEATYEWKRQQEYPTIDECVHAILDDGLDALQVLRQAVKDKYPKE